MCSNFIGSKDGDTEVSAPEPLRLSESPPIETERTEPSGGDVMNSDVIMAEAAPSSADAADKEMPPSDEKQAETSPAEPTQDTSSPEGVEE